MNGFSEHVPGNWSSHPRSLLRQGPIFVLCTLIPLITLVVLSVYLCVDFDLWKDLIRHTFHGSVACKCLWLKCGAIVGSATLGAFLTMMLMHSLAVVHDGKGGDDTVFPTWLVLLTGLSWIIPVAFSLVRHYVAPSTGMYLLGAALNLLCFVPIIALMIWIKLHRSGGNSAPDDEKARRSHGIRAVVYGMVAALALIPIPEPPSAVGLILAVRIVWAVGWTCAAIVALVAWMRGFRGPERKEPQKEEEEEDAVPEWVDGLRASLPEGVTLENDIRRTIIPQTSRPAPDAPDELLMFMGDNVPTMDQAAFFRKFRDQYENAWTELLDNNKSDIEDVSCDLLLSGVEGSGRSEILLASAMYSSLVRGQGVLYICETKAQAEALKRKFDSRVNDLMLSDFVRGEVLTKPLVDSLKDTTTVVAIPNVLFSTPSMAEECFFSDASAIDAKSMDALKNVMLEYATMMVDDFSSYPLVQRVHVAYLMDKWRLVLSSHLVLSQFVVSISPVFRPEGAQEFGKRLFATNFNVDADVVSIRPRDTSPYWSGTIRVSAYNDIDRSVREIIRCCLDAELRVLYYSRGMSENEKLSIMNELEASGAPLRLCSSLDEVSDSDAGGDAVLYLSLTSGNAAAAIRLRVGETSAVFLRIVSESEAEIQPISERILPLPSVTAVPPRIYHLMSVLPFIPENTPVADDIWSKFGVTMTSSCLRSGINCSVDSQPARWFYDSWVESGGGRRVSPYLVLENRSGAGVRGWHVDPAVLPDPQEVLWKIDSEGEGQRIVLARPSREEPHGRSLVEWRDGDGNPVGESDFAHAECFEFYSGFNTYVLDHLEKVAAGNERHTAIAVGQYSRGVELDFVFPERTLAWGLDGARARTDLRGMGRMVTFSLENHAGYPMMIAGGVSGMVNAFGRLSDFQNCGYSYPAYVSCVILGPTFSPADDPEVIDSRLSSLLHGDVRTGNGGYSPALTHAFSGALRAFMDGASFYASTPVFRCESGENAPGRAVVWFIEPVSSGRTLHPLFSNLMFNQRFMRKFVELMGTALERFDTLEHMRMMSSVAYKGDVVDDHDIAEAKSLLKDL